MATGGIPSRVLLLAAFGLFLGSDPLRAGEPDSLATGHEANDSVGEPVDSSAALPRYRLPEVTITALRVPVTPDEATADVSVLSASDLFEAGAPSLDAALRRVPSFQPFRRSDSRTANPTTQGVSFRGVGGSGASRAIVLENGIPIQDPFGGWVLWSMVPRITIDRVEVRRGSASDLHGSGAMSGTVHLLTLPEDAATAVRAQTFYGSHDTRELAGTGSLALGRVAAGVAAESFETDGYIAVDPAARGAVDTEVSSEHRTVTATLRDSSGSVRWFQNGLYFEESRENGTPLQTNATRVRRLGLGLDAETGAGPVSARGYLLSEDYDQSFSAIDSARQSERLTRKQRVPTTSLGMSAQHVGSVGSVGTLAGLDARTTEAVVDETVFTPGGTLLQSSGGRQTSGGLFLEAQVPLGAATRVHAGGRVESWHNGDAFRDTGSGPVPLSSRDEVVATPRVAVRTGRESWGVFASYGRGFRAPSLNELYRPFRVGNVVTLANESLEAERNTSWEIGANGKAGGSLEAAATLFLTDVEGAVSNVTVSDSAGVITRRRTNLGVTRARGAEVSASYRFSRAWSLEMAYLGVDARVREFDADPSLVGNRVPQVPEHTTTLQLSLRPNGRVRGAVQARWVSDQYDDDQNRFRLRAYALVNASIEVDVGGGLLATLGVENLTDERYDIARTPVLSTGMPRTVRAGLDFTLGR